MNKKTANIIALLISMGISFVGYLISLVAFPMAASLIDWSPPFLSIIFGIASFLLIWICTFVITKKRGIRAAILLPILFSIIGGIATSGVKFENNKYRHGYLAHSGLYNSLGFKIIDGWGEYYLANSPYYGEVIVQLSYHKAKDDDGDYIYDSDEDELIWEGTVRIYSLDGGYIEEKPVREWVEEDSYDAEEILIKDFEDSYDYDCYARI